jgi:hypothetical protein
MRAVAGSARSGLVAGLLAGAAISFTTTAAPVAVGILVAVAVSRRWRALLDAAIGLAAALAPTLVWRQRALGGVTVTAGHPSWSAFEAAMAQIREYFWSNRLLQWLPIAGAIGALRLLPELAVLAATWLAAAAIVIVATPSEFAGGRLLISLIPSWPAYALLVAAIPALLPTLVTRCAGYLTPEPRVAAVPKATAIVAVALLAVLPLALVALLGR